MFGDDAQTAIEDDLRRFKQLIETGEVSTGARYRTSPKQTRRDADAVEMMTEPYPAR